MLELTSISAVRDALGKRGERSVGFVPTMGNLHAGHIALVEEARAANAIVVCSIFVNPLQFGPSEDLDAYPRTLEEDRCAVKEAGCDYLFLPSADELYGQDMRASTSVSVPQLGAGFCGASRPGHFDGVTTVVAKLFNIVQPDDAYFGLKDYQQYLIVRKMTTDLSLPITIHGVATQREESGLALSSRNGYLSAADKARAPALHRALQFVGNALAKGARNYDELVTHAESMLQEAGFECDYFGIANADTLAPAAETDRELILLAAARLGTTRLIDNLRVTR